MKNVADLADMCPTMLIFKDILQEIASLVWFLSTSRKKTWSLYLRIFCDVIFNS